MRPRISMVPMKKGRATMRYTKVPDTVVR